MKRILLTSTALVGFAGAAAAEVSWSGSATLGYNDDIRDGIYADVDLDVTLSQELDNGISVSVTFGWELEDHRGPANSTGNTFSADNNVSVAVTSDMASLYYGDTAYAPETYWNGVTNMAQDGFSEQDSEEVLRAEINVGNFSAGVSTPAEFYLADGDEVNQLGFAGVYDAGTFTVGFAYQEEDDFGGTPAGSDGDYNTNEVFGIFASGSFGGADVKVAYAEQSNDAGYDEDSLGIEVAYPVGPVTVTAFYVAESITDADGDEASYGLQVDYANGPLTVTAFYHDGIDEDNGIHVSYDLGTGLVIYAGYADDDGQYIGGEYDLGSGAMLTVSYAEDEDNALNDEIGPQEYLHGTTVAMSFSF